MNFDSKLVLPINLIFSLSIIYRIYPNRKKPGHLFPINDF